MSSFKSKTVSATFQSEPQESKGGHVTLKGKSEEDFSELFIEGQRVFKLFSYLILIKITEEN